MKDERVVEIIDVNERFQSGIALNFGKIIGKVGTYRKDLIDRFDDNLSEFISRNQEVFDKIFDMYLDFECMFEDLSDIISDKAIVYVDMISSLVSKKTQTEKKEVKSKYKLQSMGGSDNFFDDEISELREFRLEDYDTDEYKTIRRGRK